MILTDAINLHYEDCAQEPPRRYIGASGISDCDAAIAFSLRGFPNDPPSPRIQRVFKLGHLLEEVVIKDLQAAGFKLTATNPKTGKQWSYSAWGGHVKCHLDGIAEIDVGEVVLEIKSMNGTSWRKFRKHGIQKSHPLYYRQMQMCMAMAGIKKAWMVAYCKDTSEYHDEVVEWDHDEQAVIETKITTVMTNDAERISNDPEFWQCKGCFKRTVCRGGGVVPMNCATCANSKPLIQGKWFCGVSGEAMDSHDGCSEWVRYEPKQ